MVAGEVNPSLTGYNTIITHGSSRLANRGPHEQKETSTVGTSRAKQCANEFQKCDKLHPNGGTKQRHDAPSTAHDEPKSPQPPEPSEP